MISGLLSLSSTIRYKKIIFKLGNVWLKQKGFNITFHIIFNSYNFFNLIWGLFSVFWGIFFGVLRPNFSVMRPIFSVLGHIFWCFEAFFQNFDKETFFQNIFENSEKNIFEIFSKLYELKNYLSRNYMSWNYMSRNYMKCYWAMMK